MRVMMTASVVLGMWALSSCPAPGQAPAPAGDSTATYVVAMLYKGSAWTAEETPETQKVRDAHAAHIQRLADQGHLLLAGRFAEGGDLRGMLIFMAATLEEARALCDADPAIKAGRLRAELHKWYSARDVRVSWEVPFPISAVPSG